MPDSLVPASDLPDEIAAPSGPAPASVTAKAPVSGGEVPAADIPDQHEVPANDLPHDIGGGKEAKDEIYGGGMQQAVAGLEGIAKGVAGPLATLAETKLLGVNPEDIIGREEANPWTHGIGEVAGFGGSMLTGVGEAALLGRAGQAAEALAKTAEIGKVGQTALKLGLEGGLFHAADNTSKMILGQTDPEAPVASLLAGMPAAVLLGGGLGVVGGKAAGKLQEMADSKAANGASKWLADFGNTFEFFSKNKEPVAQATGEAQHLFDTVSSAVNDGFSLKRESIEKLTKDLDPAKASAYVNGLRATLSNVPKSMANSELFQEAMQQWESKVSATTDMAGGRSMVSPADIFEATDELKRSMQHWASFEKRISDPSSLPFVRNAAKLSNHIRTSLENPGAWGEMGNFQKELNGAYSKMQAPLKDFISSAMSKREGMPEVDPAKIASIFRSVTKGKPGVGFRADKVADFFDPARKFLSTVDALHAAQGLESGIPQVPTTVLDKMLEKEISSGAKAGEWLFGAGPGAIGWAGAHAVGTAVGAAGGHPYLGYRAGEHLSPLIKEMGMKPIKSVVAGVLRALSAGEPGAIPAAAHYAEGINNGAKRIENSINNVFKLGGKQYLESDHSEKHREELKKHIEQGTLQQQIQNGAQQTPVAPQAEEPKGFAHGGEVMAPEPSMPSAKPVGKAVPKKDHIAAVFPEQSMLLGAAKGRINNYLNQIRPKTTDPRRPFDDHIEDKAKKKSYHQALDIANKPLSVLDHVKNGTLEPSHMQHLNQLYPELTSHLQKKLTEKVTEAQMKNEKPPYKVRQSLSLFMGAALDSNLTPQNIMAAQATFANQKADAQGGMVKPARGAASLENAPDQYRTSAQSSQLRQTRPKP